VTSAETRAACLDAETLAAWMDGGLSGSDLASAEAHAATCMRCQTMLAAMAKTAPVPVVSARSWRRFLVPALVPLTAVTAVAIWLAVPQNEITQAPVASVAPIEADQPRPVAPPPPPVQDDARAGVESRVQTIAPKQRADIERRERAVGQLAEAPAATPPAAAAPVPAPPAPSAANAEFSAPAETKQSSLAARSETVRLANEQATAQKASGRAALDVIAPEPPKGWRVNNDRVERSTDGGSTWTVQYSEPDAGLIALSSPSPNVCWVVGRAGLVLLTTDGRTWQRLSFPKTGDLASVLASDEKNAVVFSGEGTVYVTQDAGRTWSSPKR
jgi:hypothetical protein